MSIKLFVGLGNPGTQYAATRHNAGAWFVEQLAQQQSVTLRSETKFHSQFARCKIDQHECYLQLPTTFMNNSGQAVVAIMNYYKISLEEILIAHDELDLPAGITRLKKDGGHGGHNGLRSIIDHLNSKNFLRLRVGISRPQPQATGIDYVLSAPSKSDQKLITNAIENVIDVVPLLCNGEIDKAMQQLHTGD